MSSDDTRLETTLVHAGAEPDPATGAVAPPLHLSTTFVHGPALEDLYGHGYSYSRYGNPTQDRLEEALAAADGGTGALVFASGLGAAAAYLLSLEPGAHVLMHHVLYHGVRSIPARFFDDWGKTVSDVDARDLDALRAAVRPETRALWIETPTNPMLEVLDLEALGSFAREAGVDLVVDSTFAPPTIQRPLDHGATVVMHSTTKYFGGHSDVVGGALVFTDAERLGRCREVRTRVGSVANPFATWLVLRGLRSLSCRVAAHSANALAVARALEAHPGVEAVHYPGLESHPGHALARRQMKAFGGMLSFQVKGGEERSLEVAGALRLFQNATSLGGPESLVEHRARVEGPDSKLPRNLLRLSVGLEHADDLVADLERALG